MFSCIFLTNILQNRRKRIGEKLLDDGTRHGHTSTHCRATIGPPAKCHSKCFRCCIAKKEERKAGGGGVGDQLESPVETHSMFEVFFFFFACVVVVVFYGWGGGKLLV